MTKPRHPGAFASAGLLLVLLLLGAGCGGRQGMDSPQLYGGPPDTGQTATDSLHVEEGHRATAADRSDRGQDAASPHEIPADPEVAPPAEPGTREQGRRLMAEMADDLDASASAVDDDIWRQFELAEEYYLMGVLANREASWEEAQYYFEKGLRVLANLDIEADSSDTPEAAKYNQMLDNFVADYRVTLRSLGRLEPDASSSVLVERFGDVEQNLDDDSIVVVRGEDQPVTYDLPVVMNERVKNSIVYFQTVAKDNFRRYLQRSHKYRDMMLRIIDQYGLPRDLIYLSLVESGYRPDAYSWARAMGLWQFISSTGRLYGLERSWWIDERRDPVKSTHSACRFLKDLYEKFGDWELAMAAYNGGPGRVERTIKSQGTRDFWKLRLKRQTMDYVPLIYAATIIAKNPEKYGFHDVVFEPEVVYDEVEIDRCLELSAVAREVGCSLEDLQDLNPELLRKYTPPNTKQYKLKIPKGSRGRFLAALDNLPSPKETSWVRHRISRGETVSTIAAKYGVSQYAILAANDMSARSTIYAGKELIVPVPLDRDVSGSPRQQRDPEDYSAKNSVYSVRSGDTMWDIARAFGTTVDDLRQANHIARGSRIYVGQKLRIPSSARNLKSKNAESSDSPVTYAGKDSGTSSAGSGGSAKHRVRPGDTLWDIAREHGTTTSRIRALNSLGRDSRIYPGQVLTVSDGSIDYVVHKVRQGDTLSRLAQKYRTSVARIMATNELNNADDLQVGQQLKIYTR